MCVYDTFSHEQTNKSLFLSTLKPIRFHLRGTFTFASKPRLREPHKHKHTQNARAADFLKVDDFEPLLEFSWLKKMKEKREAARSCLVGLQARFD